MSERTRWHERYCDVRVRTGHWMEHKRNTVLSTERPRGGKSLCGCVWFHCILQKADATVTSSAPNGDLGGFAATMYQPRARQPCGWRTKIHRATGLTSQPLGVGLVLPEGQTLVWMTVGLEVDSLSLSVSLSLSLSSHFDYFCPETRF